MDADAEAWGREESLAAPAGCMPSTRPFSRRTPSAIVCVHRRFPDLSGHRPAASEAELVDHVLGDVPGRTKVRTHQSVGPAVERSALREQFPDGAFRVGRLEQGPMGLVTHARPDCFRRSPEADDERVRLEAFEIGGVHHQAAAGGDDRPGAGLEFLDDGTFQLAEGALAIFREDPRDRLSGLLFDEIISVDKIEVQLCGDHLAHRRLAGAHEAGEGEIPDGTRFVHQFDLPYWWGAGTQFLGLFS